MLKRKFSAIDEEGERARMSGAQANGYNGDAPFFSSQISSATRPAPFSPAGEDEDEDPNDGGDAEFEIEEEDYIIPYTIRSSITTQECAEWTQLIHVQAMHKGKEIGRADGRYIDRDQIREYFHEAMDEPSEETMELSTELFDSRGRLRSELRAGEGSGIWGNEMNTGGFLFVQKIEVEKEWQGKGVGRDLVEAFMKKGQSWKEDVQFVFAKPGQVNSSENEIEQQGKTRDEVTAAVARATKKTIAFWRAIGFRRIAGSDWFATAFDPLHAVHQLAIEDDYDIRDDTVLERHQEREQNVEKRLGSINGALMQHEALLKSMFQNDGDGESDPSDDEDEEDEEEEDEDEDEEEEEVKNEWPVPLPREELRLRVALVTFPDDQCLDLWKSPLCSQTLLEGDSNGNNILHIAAIGCRPLTLSFILGDVLTAEMKASFISAANNHGQTPLHILAQEISRGREFTSGPAHEKSLVARECLSIFRNDQRSANSCTCGECLDGFISPRMKYALLVKGEFIHDMLQDGIDGDDWVEWHNTWLTLVDFDTRKRFRRNPDLRQAFANVFHSIASCLQKDQAPSSSTVISEGMTSEHYPISYFVDLGGKVESALGQCLAAARDAEEDGSHYEVFEEEIEQLPECANDSNFGLVADFCGIRREDLDK